MRFVRFVQCVEFVHTDQIYTFRASYLSCLHELDYLDMPSHLYNHHGIVRAHPIPFVQMPFGGNSFLIVCSGPAGEIPYF